MNILQASFEAMRRAVRVWQVSQITCSSTETDLSLA